VAALEQTWAVTIIQAYARMRPLRRRHTTHSHPSSLLILLWQNYLIAQDFSHLSRYQDPLPLAR